MSTVIDSLVLIDNFVAKLDLFVKLLEQDTEAKMRLLRLVQGIALFMTLVLIFVAMYQLHSGRGGSAARSGGTGAQGAARRSDGAGQPCRQ
jgi:hypothetical protein